MLIGSMRMSALHLAAQEGNVNCASLLLNRGADPHAKNARGQSALHLAALSQSPETMELLLSKGRKHNKTYIIKHCATIKKTRVNL